MTKTDIYIIELRRHLGMCANILEARGKTSEREQVGMSLHFSRIRHTNIMLNLVNELRGVVEQDPENWDDEPDVVPF